MEGLFSKASVHEGVKTMLRELARYVAFYCILFQDISKSSFPSHTSGCFTNTGPGLVVELQRQGVLRTHEVPRWRCLLRDLNVAKNVFIEMDLLCSGCTLTKRPPVSLPPRSPCQHNANL